mmetsp:Transcript_5080/g.10983  ORF Transcript_5080/g.10983 Transcript_5080/m.10983 type:complete len:228 (+) Transcript_5080:530-1213(+)
MRVLSPESVVLQRDRPDERFVGFGAEVDVSAAGAAGHGSVHGFYRIRQDRYTLQRHVAPLTQTRPHAVPGISHQHHPALWMRQRLRPDAHASRVRHVVFLRQKPGQLQSRLGRPVGEQSFQRRGVPREAAALHPAQISPRKDDADQVLVDRSVVRIAQGKAQRRASRLGIAPGVHRRGRTGRQRRRIDVLRLDDFFPRSGQRRHLILHGVLRRLDLEVPSLLVDVVG